MKKILVYIGLAFVTVLGNTNNSIAQTQVQEGNVIIDPYYGGPNFGKNFFTFAQNENIDIIGIGPAGLRVEFMLTDNFGLGGDFIYNSISGSGTVDSLGTNPSTGNEIVIETYDLKVFARRYRVQLRANYHFAQTDNVDAYVGFGAGTNIRSIGFETDYKGYKGPNLTAAIFPVSFRLAIGTRYYITDNLGFNVELGLGGPVVSGGISLKF